jgi:IS4 transposase
MNRRHFSSLARRLKTALRASTITQIGRDTGLTQRLRDVTPHRLTIALLTSLSCYKTTTLADILRVFNALSGRSVRYKPFHNQLAKEAFPVFTWRVFQRLLDRLVVRVLAPLPGNALRRFDDILLQDGSSFALVDKLRHTFPGRFTKISPAAVELHATMSLFEDQAISVQLAPDADGERQFLPEPSELRRKLLIADRGYMDIDYCERVDVAGGSFIVRFKKHVNPLIHDAMLGRSRRPSWKGKQLVDIRDRLEGKSADLLVSWGKDARAFRLLFVWNRKNKEHMILATNLPADAFDLADVRQLYRLRWQVELLFKEWKSYANLHAFGTSKAGIAEGLIWASLAAALLKRFIAHVTELVVRDVEISTRNVAMAFGYKAHELLRALLQGRDVEKRLKDLVHYLAGNARRAHPKRDRQSGRLAFGLRPLGLSVSGAALVKN